MDTAIDPALLPSAEDCAFYREHGYYITQPIFSETELDAAIAASERYYATLDQPQIALPNDRTYHLAWWKGAGADTLRKNDYTTQLVPELAALRDKPVLGAIAALLVGEDVRLWHDQLLYKPPHNPDQPQNVGWHTDHGYWKTCTSDQLLTAWVPFTDADEAIGTISFVDGSLHWPDNGHLDFFSSDLDGLEQRFKTGGRPVVKYVAAMRRGQVSFHHCRTIHGSGPNLTDGPRRSIALHMQPASNDYVQTYRDGQLLAHPNDNLTRGPNGAPDYADPIYCPVLGRYAQAAALLA